MFRRARLSVKPNVKPGIGSRGSTTSTAQRGAEVPRLPEPATASAPNPAEPTDVPLVDFGRTEPQEKASRSSDEKTDGENNVEKPSKPSAAVSQRRKRVSSTSSLDKPSISVSSEPHPLPAVNQEIPQPNPMPTKEKQPCSDRYRIYKAQKLREMLKEELRKEKKQWKNKYAINESQKPPDRSKMTMRDFIYYLPNNNPMISSLEQEKKTEKSSTPVQTRELESKTTPDAEENEEIEEESDDGPLLVPRVKVAEDGSIILDEESLTVEVLRTKGPCVVEENDPIFERGSTTTYSSFRKNYYSKPWSNKETDMFFLAISMVGTDFSMIGQLFPHRARIEIKNKFKREEKANGWRIDKAFQEKRPFDFDFFAHLLQKVLAEEEKRKQKSVKNHNSKEKKSSKPRKKVKGKKVVSKEVNDGPNESMSTHVSDREGLQKDVQTVEEQQPSLAFSEQDSGQITLESDLNQKKRQRRNQNETDEQVRNLSGSATVQSSHSKGGKHKSKCESLRPEVNDSECNREQKLSCLQDTDDIVDLLSSEKVEKRTDPILSSSNQQDATVATECSESSTSNLPSSEVGARTLSEVNNAESRCTKERNVDLKNKLLETDQTENIKPIVRGRFQRPKPNLSRAVGKKPVISQGKTDSENKSSHPETSVEKPHMEKDKMNKMDSLGMENSEKENTEAETISKEKICLQEDTQLKAFRHSRLMRGQLRRPKPNVGKVAERKEILTSEEKIEPSEEKKENESCIDRDIPEQMEDQSYKNYDCGDTTSQPENEDASFQNVQPQEPKMLYECLSVQENNEANIVKQAPIVRTQFQKPKPNIRRGTGRRELSLREEVPENIIASGEKESALKEIARLPHEKVLVEANTTKEMDKDLKDTIENVPEMINIAVDMESGFKETGRVISPKENVSEVVDVLEEIETDLEETGREISPREKTSEEVKTVSEEEKCLKKTRRETSRRKKIPKMIVASEEREPSFEETGREISPQEKASEEVKTVGEIKKSLKKTEREISRRKKIPEMIVASEEREPDLEETGREISPQEKALEKVKTVGEMKKSLKKTEREISQRNKIPEMIVASEKRKPDLEETGGEISPQEKASEEVKTIGEIKKSLKKTESEISRRNKIPEMIVASEEREPDLEETGGEIFPQEKASEEVKTVGEIKKSLKKTEREISQRNKIPEMIVASEKRKPDLEETGGEISPQEKASEEVKTVGEIKKSLKKTEREIFPRRKVPEMIAASEEIEQDLEETGRGKTSPREKAPEEVKTVGEVETGLEESRVEVSPGKKIPEMTVASEERETHLEETGRGEISPWEKAPEEVKIVGKVEKSLPKTGREISSRKKIPKMIAATEEREPDLEETGRRETSPQEPEKTPEEVSTVSEMDKDLKIMEREIYPRKKISEMIATSEEKKTDLEEKEREISPKGKVLKEVKTVGEMETDLEETRKAISPKKKIPDIIGTSEVREGNLEETGRREIFPGEKSQGEVTTIGEVETDLEETEGEISPREKVLEEVSAIEEREIDLKETGKENIFLMDKLSGKMTIFEEMEDLKDTGAEIFLRERGSEEMSATEETVADLKNTAKIDTAPRKSEPEEDGSSRQTETNLIQSSSDHCSHMPPPDIQNISSDMLLTLHTSVEEERNSEKEVSSQLSESKTSLQTSEVGITEDQGIQSPDGPEQFSYTNLSKSLPQEQNPFEVKTAPFVRSRFKRPKPNLARAALRRENTDTGKYIPEKKLETDKMETLTIQQNSEETNNHPSQDDVGSLMTPRERVESGHKEEKDVISPCIQTENSVSYSHSGEPKEESQFMQAQENDLVASAGACNINTFQEEMKDGGIQAQPMRRRLQRPRPNIRKIEKRQLVEKGDTKDIIKEEKPVLSTDGTEKFLAVPNSQIGTEIEVVSTKVSECRINENQSHVVLVENLHVNKLNILDEKIREEHKTYAPSPTQLVRRQSQKAKPNLRMAHSKRKEPEPEKDMADHSEARKPEGNLLQQGDSDIQFLPKKKTKLLTSLEISARKDYIGPKEPVLAKKDAQSEELGPLGSATKETSGDNSVSSIIKEQYLSKPASCPRLLKEPNYSKIALDRRTAISSASECEIGHNERKIHRKSKPNVTKGRASKRNRGKSSKKEPRASKSVLVTLRASQEEEDDDDEDFASDYEEESYHLAPEEVNKAPVFVPLGLRSPEPVATQIEETMEELEITVNVPDTTCIDTVEHHFSNTDVTTQEMKQEENLSALSIEMTTGEHNQDETGTNDGSTEAAIALLTMGDLVLQSEISTEQGDGIGVLPEVHSKDNIHIPSSPGDRKHSITHECQELSLPVISVSPASLEENKIVLEEQSTTREESGLMEKVKENAVPARNTVSKVTNNLRIRSRFPKPKPNLTRILGTKRLVAHREVPSLFVTKGQEVEIQTETEKNTIKETDSEDKNLGSIITAEKKEQSKLACAHGMEGTRISQEANLTERNESQEERSEEVQRLSVVSAETVPHLLGLDRGLGEPLTERSIEDSVLTLREPECPPTSMSEVQQENVISPQDIAVNLVANVHQDGEDEQAFILTLVEIPTNAVEEFTNTATQLMPNPFLPAPILVKSVNKEERGDMSMSFPITSIGQDNICLYNSGRDDSENPAADLDFISRKRVHCRLEDSNCVSPAKKCSLTSRHDYREYTSEVCSKELINVFEETGEPYKEQNIFPTSGSTNITPDPQKEQLEPTLQNIGTTFLDKTDTQKERSTPQSPQDGMIVLDKEERTIAASKSEQVDSRTSSLKTPLSRPGRRPLGFLSLICSKNSLESEPTQVHSKKRLKPVIPVSRKNLKRSNPPKENQKKPQESSDPLASSSVVNTQSENTDSLTAQVPCDLPLLKEECKSSQNQTSEEELTTISEYFFNDIFIEVDETE